MKWMVLFLIFGVNEQIKAQTNGFHNISLKTGYFSTVGISTAWEFSDNQKIIGTFGYRLPGGWRSYGSNTRLGSTLGWSVSKRILGGLSAFSFVGGYGASVSYKKNTHNFPNNEWFSFGLLIGGGLSYDWQALHIAINFLPGYELSGQPEWRSNWYLWKGFSLSAGIKWNH